MTVSKDILLFATPLGPKELALNLAVSIFVFLLLSLFFALVLYFCELLLLKFFKNRTINFNLLPYFVIYLLFITINFIYLFLFIKGILENNGLEKFCESNFYYQSIRILFLITILYATILFSKLKNKILFFLENNQIIFLFLSIFFLVLSLVFLSFYNFAYHGTAYFDNKNISLHKKYLNKPNIILISLDTLIVKHMPLYGAENKTTSYIDILGKESYIFKNMHSVSNKTIASLPNFLGRYSLRSFNSKVIDIDYRQNLASYLYDRGYNTIFMSPAIPCQFFKKGVFSKVVRLSRVDSFIPFNLSGNIFGKTSMQWTRDIFTEWLYILETRFFPLINGEVQYWFIPEDLYFNYAEKYLSFSNEPLFLWVHILAPHKAKEFLYRWDDSFLNPSIKGRHRVSLAQINKIYDQRLIYIDNLFGRFLRNLQEKGVYKNSIIILTSDHGEVLDDEKEARALHVQEDAIRVPLLIHLPGQKEPKIINNFVNHVDIAPTILDILGISIPKWVEGESLVKYMQTRESGLSPKPKFAVSANCDRNKGKAVIFLSGYKLIYNLDTKVRRLYYLIDDPEERNNLYSRNEEMAHRLENMLKVQLSKWSVE